MILKINILFFLLSPISCLRICLSKHQNRHLECSNLNEVPQGLEYIEVLNITNSSLTNISSNIFYQKQFVSLKAIILQSNCIRNISEHALCGLSNLILLDLSRNELEELQGNAFQGGTFLKILILSENRIKRLHQQTLAGLRNLIYLDISRNNITDIPRKILKNLPSLKYLDISYNPLRVIPQESLLASKSLAVLRVSLSGTSSISPKVFMDLPHLQVLDLSGSNLASWPDNTLSPLVHLHTLYMRTVPIINEEVFVPGSLKKFQQAEMSLTSDSLVNNILSNLDLLDVNSNEIEIEQYFDDEIYEIDRRELLPEWSVLIVQKALLFTLLAYLSFVYIMCIAQIVKSFIQKPYQRIMYVDEI